MFIHIIRKHYYSFYIYFYPFIIHFIFTGQNMSSTSPSPNEKKNDKKKDIQPDRLLSKVSNENRMLHTLVAKLVNQRSKLRKSLRDQRFLIVSLKQKAIKQELNFIEEKNHFLTQRSFFLTQRHEWGEKQRQLQSLIDSTFFDVPDDIDSVSSNPIPDPIPDTPVTPVKPKRKRGGVRSKNTPNKKTKK